MSYENTPENYDKHFKEHPERWEKVQNIDLKIKEEISKIKKPIKLLDMGCGQGRTISVIKELNNLEIIGIDFSKEALNLACNTNPHIKFKCVNMERTKLQDKEFDVILSVGSHEHLKQVNFSEPFRLLKDDGLFLCVLPCSKNDLGWVEGTPQSEWKYSANTWRIKLSDFKFRCK